MKALIDIGRYGAEIITDDRVEWIPMEWLRAAYAAYIDRFGVPPVPDDEIKQYVWSEAPE
jgi:hypothetical protein